MQYFGAMQSMPSSPLSNVIASEIEYNILEEQKKEKYKDLDIFAQNKKSIEVNNEQEMIQPEILPVKVHKNIFEKIFDYIKGIFKKDK